MIRLVHLTFAVLLSVSHIARATDEVVVIGDSLSKEYEVEFANLKARNWIEILDEHRHAHFDIGSFKVFPDFRLTGHEYNWSVPGSTSDAMWDRLTDDGFFNDFAIDKLEDQLRKEAERVVIMLGGNDVENKYQRLYIGDGNQRIIDRIYLNLERTIDWVQRRKRGLQITLVNVPHVGATPKVRQEFPDPANTQRVTDSLQELNTRLAELAREKGIAYADIFTFTLDIIEQKPFCISGQRFRDAADGGADRTYLWLGGTLADDFHPNTIGQAVMANAVIDAFNTRYESNIDPLGGSEILSDIVGIRAARTYTEWATCYDLGSADQAGDDMDGDGLDNLTEYALDMDPQRAERLPVRVDANTLRYRPRLLDDSDVSLVLEESTDLQTWTAAPAERLTMQSKGWVQWQAPMDAPQVFTRLRARLR